MGLEPGTAFVPAFLDRRRALLDVVHAAEGAAAETVRSASPFARQISYTVWSRFCANAVTCGSLSACYWAPTVTRDRVTPDGALNRACIAPTLGHRLRDDVDIH